MAADNNAHKVSYKSFPGAPPTKVDNGSSLAGNQHVNAWALGDFDHNLPGLWSPPSGAPLHQDLFSLGHRWVEAYGKIQSESGKGGF